MIDMGKKYRTRDGRAVRVLCVDANNIVYPVVALIVGENKNDVVVRYTSDGTNYPPGEAGPLNLIEVNPYDHIPIDAPVWVRDSAAGRWRPRHFAGVSIDGTPMTWQNGGTSHTERYKKSWNQLSETKPC